ncbi:MAG: peptide MFS transporter [Prevotellaceae bacterium]|jgi:POT family proton-dependent oligopeptide transporter|nr:peptide MFS transporter [Prevotellaceae bacterium]
MFKNHPKGLLGAALSNMGERFGFYIMMAVLTLFISAKFGLSEDTTGWFYSIFYCAIYFLGMAGGYIADRTKKYKATIFAGLIVMAAGYLIIAIPTPTPVPNFSLYITITCIGLLVIAIGNGLFKGNLQAVVGQMYDDKKYSEKRDAGFQIFYMFINIGGFFAPFVAIALRNWWLKVNNFDYNAALPELCHNYLEKGTAIGETSLNNLQKYADTAIFSGDKVSDLTAFCNQYLDVFNKGFQYAFMAAIVMMVVSMIIFILNKKRFPDPSQKIKAGEKEIEMDVKEIKQRIYALFAVLGIVVFFWFSFHQNGYSLTYFARDYVNLDVINIDLGFTTIKGAEIFQSVNPFFVVTLTPLVMWLFGTLKKRGKEVSTPKKIGIGMGIAALGYVFMLLCSVALPDKSALAGMDADAINVMKVTPMVMIGMYFILTVAELFISPLGLSFVSKVAPPKMQGMMQGCWLAATGLGNFILFIGGILYLNVPLWACWMVFAAACALSMSVMLFMLKWLEKITKDKKEIVQ